MSASIISKIDRRILPVLILAYIVAYIDRINIGIAALQMNADIGLTATVFGFGAAIFSLPFLLGEIPSNKAMEKFGACRWIARIMIGWGLVSTGMAFIEGPHSYVIMRLLLGAAESGLFPGVMLYFTYWYPPSQRARVIGIFQLAVPIAGLLGAPLSAWLLGLDGFLHIRGWRWMFLSEGIPAVALGFLCLYWLTDKPATATWLSAEERNWLENRISTETLQKRGIRAVKLLDLLRNRTVLLLGLVYAGQASMTATLSIWLPQIIKTFKVSNLDTGFLTAIPYGLSAVLMVLCAVHSDRTKERVWHVAIPTLLSALGLVLCLVFRARNEVLVLLSVAVCGIAMMRGPLWALCSEWLSTSATAVGLALINMMGTVAVILCTYLVGLIKDHTGNFFIATLPLVAFSLVAGIAVIVAGAPPTAEHSKEAA